MSTEAAPTDAHAFRPTLIALIVAAAFFMETLDGTVIATALPSMAQSFGVGAIQLSIGITAYMLTLAIFIPASGWLADRFGTRTVFCGAIFVFTLILAASPRISTASSRRAWFQGASAADVACRALGGAAQHRETRSLAGNGDHDLARTPRARSRAADRRVHHNLCKLAMDILSERSARDYRNHHGASLRRRISHDG
jgi:hypothetical protein